MKKFFPFIAKVSEFDESEFSTAQAVLTVAETRTASPSPIGEDHRPRILKISGWMVHADYPNDNGEGFYAADLEEVVNNGLFAPPNLGMIDFNHDFNGYGALYSAKYEWDSKANAFGIFVEGMIWSWRHEEIANILLATQVRQGFIPMSAAWLPHTVEYAETDGQQWQVSRKPVFFAVSVLDIRQADPHSKAIGSEDPESTSEDRKKELQVASASEDIKEEKYMDELIALVKQLLEEKGGSDLTDTVRAALDEKLGEFKAAMEELPQLRTQLETANARVTELESLLGQATVERDEAKVALEGIKSQLETANTRVEELEAYKAEIEAREQEATQTVLREKRLAELNETARAALEAEEESVRNTIVARWVAMDESEWELTKKVLNLGKRETYIDRTNREGQLSGRVSGGTDKFNIDRWL